MGSPGPLWKVFIRSNDIRDVGYHSYSVFSTENESRYTFNQVSVFFPPYSCTNLWSHSHGLLQTVVSGKIEISSNCFKCRFHGSIRNPPGVRMAKQDKYQSRYVNILNNILFTPWIYEFLIMNFHEFFIDINFGLILETII